MSEHPHTRSTAIRIRAPLRTRRSHLVATTVLGAGAAALLLFAGGPARAAGECGPATAGTVTCTAAGNPYAAGVSYTPAGGLTLNTTPDAQINGRVSVNASAGGGDVTFNHAGAVTVATDGTNAVDLGGNNVSATISGTIANTGEFVSATSDDAGNQLTPDMPAGGLSIVASGTASVTNNGAISTTAGSSSGIKVVAGGDVTIGGTGTVTTSSSATGIDITSTAGGVRGTIANVDSNGGSAVNILSQGPVTLQLDAINGSVSLTNGASDADGNPILDPAGDVALTVGTVANSLNVQNNVGGVSLDLTGAIAGSTSLTGTGPVTATIGGNGLGNSLSLASTADLASLAINAGIAGDVSVSGATSVDVTVAQNITLGSNLSATSSDGGTSARIALGAGVNVTGSVAVTGITTAALDIGRGVKIGGDASLTTSGGEANILVPSTSTVGGSVSATSMGDGTSANVEVASGATVGGGLTAKGNTTASILIEQGATAGASLGGQPTISLTSTAGGTLTNRGTFGTDSTAGFVVASGGGTTVTNSGFLAGSFYMTGSGNSVVNSGTLVLGDGRTGSIGDSGENSFTNTGVVRVGARQAAGAPVINQLAGLTQFTNSGLIDLRNLSGGDVIAISGTTDAPRARFVGSGNSTVILDVFYNRNGALIDKLTATGAITGSTRVILNPVGGMATLTPSTVFVQGGPGTTASALTIVAPASTSLVVYSTSFDPATNSFALVGTPGDGLVHLARINEGAQQLWYRSADTASAHFSEVRDARFGGYAKGGGRLWGTMYGQTSRRKGSLEAGAFGVSRDADAAYRQDTFGGQLGFDVTGFDRADGFLVGVTAGYQHSKLNFSRSADNARFNVANAGVLIGYQKGGLFLNALGQFSYYWLRDRSPDADYSDRVTGNSYGGQAELGYRLGADRLFVEPVATVAYVRTNLDSSRIADIDVDFGTYQGLRGKAGARIGSRFALGGGATVVAYAQGNYVHEFKGDDATRFDENLLTVDIRNRALPDYDEGKIGLSAGSAGGVTGFVEGFGTAGKSYRGGGGRVGIRVPM